MPQRRQGPPVGEFTVEVESGGYLLNALHADDVVGTDRRRTPIGDVLSKAAVRAGFDDRSSISFVVAVSAGQAGEQTR